MAIFGSFLGCVSRGLIVGPRNPQNRIPHEILGGFDFFLDSAHDFFFFDKLDQLLHVTASILLGKKSKLFRFFDTWGRNPVFQFSLEKFAEV